MLTRKEIESQYDINPESRLISSPGRFEGEPIYAPYFYHMMLEGFQDEVIFEDEGTEPTDIFRINNEDIDEFPELEPWNEIRMSYSEQGFVYVELR